MEMKKYLHDLGIKVPKDITTKEDLDEWLKTSLKASLLENKVDEIATAFKMFVNAYIKDTKNLSSNKIKDVTFSVNKDKITFHTSTNNKFLELENAFTELEFNGTKIHKNEGFKKSVKIIEVKYNNSTKWFVIGEVSKDVDFFKFSDNQELAEKIILAYIEQHL